MQPCLIDSIYNGTHRHSKHALWCLKSCQLLTTTRQQTNTDTDKRGRRRTFASICEWVRMFTHLCGCLRMFTHRPLERPPRPTRMESPRESLAPVPRPTAAPCRAPPAVPAPHTAPRAGHTAAPLTDTDPRHTHGRARSNYRAGTRASHHHSPPTQREGHRPATTGATTGAGRPATTDHKRPQKAVSRAEPNRPDQHQHTRTTANKAIQLLLIVRCL